MVTRLGLAGALTALSLAAVAVPAYASASIYDPCGPVVGSIKICTAMDGWTYQLPVNTATLAPMPRIGGVLKVENTLTVFDGTWEPKDAKLTHQWLRNDVPILGAVEITYKLTDQDLGKGIRVATTATALNFKKTVRSTTSVPVTAAGGAVPTITPPAKIWITTGDRPAEAGQVLSTFAEPEKWAPAGLRFHYQWQRAGRPIPGANSSAYVLTDADVGKMVRTTVTAYGPGLNPVTMISLSKPIRADYTPGAVVTGRTELGQILSSTQRPWGGTITTHKYQWLREGVVIPGATNPNYTIKAADQGRTLVLRTNSLPVSPGTFAYSNPVAVPAAANVKQLTNLTMPVLTGNPTVDVPMSVTAGTWSEPAQNLTVSYRWSYDGNITSSGAGGPTYTPGWSSIDRTISVTVTVTATGYSPTRITLNASKPVPMPEPRQSTGPVIYMTPVVGKASIVTNPVWGTGRDAQGNAATVTDTFQWFRDGVPIPGAAGTEEGGNRYTPVAADVGKRLSVKVTSTFDGRTLKTQTVAAPANVAALPALDGAAPRVTGTAVAGSVLTAVPRVWTENTALTYRWLRNGVPIVSATAATYKVTTADKGAKISVRVTGTRAGYATTSWESAALTAG